MQRKNSTTKALTAISGSKPIQSFLRQIEEIDFTLIEDPCNGNIITGELIVEEEIVNDQVRQSQSCMIPSTNEDFRPTYPVGLQAEKGD